MSSLQLVTDFAMLKPGQTVLVQDMQSKKAHQHTITSVKSNRVYVKDLIGDGEVYLPAISRAMCTYTSDERLRKIVRVIVYIIT